MVKLIEPPGYSHSTCKKLLGVMTSYPDDCIKLGKLLMLVLRDVYS